MHKGWLLGGLFISAVLRVEPVLASPENLGSVLIRPESCIRQFANDNILSQTTTKHVTFHQPGRFGRLLQATDAPQTDQGEIQLTIGLPLSRGNQYNIRIEPRPGQLVGPGFGRVEFNTALRRAELMNGWTEYEHLLPLMGGDATFIMTETNLRRSWAPAPGVLEIIRTTVYSTRQGAVSGVVPVRRETLRLEVTRDLLTPVRLLYSSRLSTWRIQSTPYGGLDTDMSRWQEMPDTPPPGGAAERQILANFL